MEEKSGEVEQPEAASNHLAIIPKAELEYLLNTREIVVDPILEDSQVKAISIDLRLDNYFAEFKSTKEAIIDPADARTNFLDFHELEFYREHYVIQPGHFVLGQTFEYIALSGRVVGLLEGRSSVGRRGLMVHVTAGVVDPGFSGHLVFELANVGKMPVLIYPLMRVARLTFVRTDAEEYAGQYSMQVKIRAPSTDSDLKKVKERIDAYHALHTAKSRTESANNSPIRSS